MCVHNCIYNTASYLQAGDVSMVVYTEMDCSHISLPLQLDKRLHRLSYMYSYLFTSMQEFIIIIGTEGK